MKSQSADSAIANQALAAYRATHGYEPSFTKLYWCVANEVGVCEALLIQIIESWCIANAKNNKRGYFYDEEWWTSATYSTWAEKYPALGTQKSIQKRLLALEKLGYVISCQPRRKEGNSAKFYRVDAVKVGTLILHDLTMVTISDEPFYTELPNYLTVVTNSDEPFYTELPIVTNSDGVVTISDGVVTNSDVVPPLKPVTERVSAPLLDQSIKLTQSITGETEKKAQEKSKETDQDKVVPDNHDVANFKKVSATNEKSTHEGQYSGAARENDSQSLFFSSDPVKEVDFLLYYQTYQRTQGKNINSVASYVTTVLSKLDEGTTEVLCLFEQWKGACRTLKRKINNFADDPAEVEKQRQRYDFPGWEAWRHDHYYNLLLSEGLSKFCKHEVSAKWYQWASAKFPERFVDIPD
ncbi:hypothetical protein H6G41_34000 [Tolypothrix sp. FACHB-123]|uniref:hypothetical protein n=1 Tax=Tolypothrix sp. FACHB-123 TaxID=2692868 RepID=UPI001683B60E|nr:hypothetical protein [Tolypothrix sp. FACHB-123]MBD2359501.1 hypothetical protein [Tolypothrix sp. FACHB-123]